GPTAAEVSYCRLLELLAKSVEPAKLAVDHVRQGTARATCYSRPHAVPEKSVVPGLRCVVVYRRVVVLVRLLDGFLERHIFIRSPGSVLVQLVYIPFVMLAVMELQRPGRHVRLKCVKIIRQLGEFECH